jgi:hypothetical protein
MTTVMSLRLAIVVALLLGAIATAQAADLAEQRFGEGVAKLRVHDFAGALESFRASYAIRATPDVLFDIALAERELGRFADAYESFGRYLASREALPAAQRTEAEACRAELRQKLCRLDVTWPADAELTLDGAVVTEHAPLMIAPGTHRLRASLRDRELAMRDIDATAGGELTVVLEAPLPVAVPAPPVARPASASSIAAPVRRELAVRPAPSFVTTQQGKATIALGSLALVLGGGAVGTGAYALVEHDRYRTSCDRLCEGSLFSRAHAAAIATDVLWPTAAAAGVVSLVLVLVRPHRHGAP